MREIRVGLGVIRDQTLIAYYYKIHFSQFEAVAGQYKELIDVY